MELNTKLKQVREYLGLPREYVAQQTGLDINSIELGEVEISTAQLEGLCKFYQLPIEKLSIQSSCGYDVASLLEFKHMMKKFQKPIDKPHPI